MLLLSRWLVCPILGWLLNDVGLMLERTAGPDV